MDARAVLEKHPEDSTAKFFAKLGGPSLDHCERDLHRKCKQLYGVDLEPYFITVSTQSEKDETVPFELATLAPHEVFAALHKAGEQFRTSLLGMSLSDGGCLHELIFMGNTSKKFAIVFLILPLVSAI